MIKFIYKKNAQTSAIATAVSVSILMATGNIATPAVAATLAQDVTGVRFGSLVDNPDSTVNGVTYLNQSLPVTGVTANSIDWVFGADSQPVVTLRRGGYAPTDNFGNYNNRQLILSEGIPELPVTTVRISQPTTSEALLNQNNIFQGAERTIHYKTFVTCS
ncbi:hypothetical protein NIES2101_13320 [Calothrix sp. HK-06]|nr:hypothetical protein NIES2101_13320 [Calothrix sp. HK-06]